MAEGLCTVDSERPFCTQLSVRRQVLTLQIKEISIEEALPSPSISYGETGQSGIFLE